MKRIASLVGLVILVTACSGDTDTVSKSSTTQPTVVSTSTAQPTATPTTVSANTTAPKATSTAISAAPVELAVRCSFDQLIPQISCRASATVEGSELRWKSNVGGWKTGLSYEVQLVEPYQLVAQVVVTLQECRGSDCQTVETVIDTSAIAIDPDKKVSNDQPSSGPSPAKTAAELVRTRWTEDCEGEGTQMLTASPMSPADIDFIKPLGALSSVHITPVSHQYFYPLENVVADIRSPASGNIIYLSNRGIANTEGSYGGASGQDYEVQYVIEITCDLFLVIDHVLGVPESVRTALGNRRSVQVRIPVAAGELLGQHTNGFKTDFSVIDLSRGETDGFVRNSSYYQGQEGESFKLFEQDTFEYFDEPLRSQLAEKSLRLASPRGGFFTYDVVGTAQGTWFQEGTNGYVGNIEDKMGAYYVGHLALVPDHIDPSKLRVSIGDEFRGEQMGRQWGVAGDAPSFATVTTDSGIVTYELRRLVPCDGSSPETINPRSKAFQCSAEKLGTLQIELLDEQRMRVEVFFTNSPTDNARIYVR